MLVFDTRSSGRIHGAKSASRRKTIGQAIDTSMAHVITATASATAATTARAGTRQGQPEQRQDPDDVEAEVRRRVQARIDRRVRYIAAIRPAAPGAEARPAIAST